jgi:hypothetical protein
MDYNGVNTMTPSTSTKRFLLWIDAVGGFLVCMGDRVVLGQAVPNGPADVPLWGDLSRQHATIGCDSGGYWIEPTKQVNLGGVELTRPAALVPGAEFTLGGIRLRFTRPSPLSGSARLDLLSRHQTQPTCHGILLMRDTLILGPTQQCHVVCRDWPASVVLFRQGPQLICRYDGKYMVDGANRVGRSDIGGTSNVTGPGFSLTLEPLE